MSPGDFAMTTTCDTTLDMGATSPIGTGQATVVTTPVYAGNYALQLSTSGGSGQYVTIYQDLSGGAESLTYTSFYVYIANPAVTVTLATGEDLQGDTMWAIVYDASRHGLDTYLFNGASTLRSV